VSPALAVPNRRHIVEHLLLRITPGVEQFERTLNERRAFRIWYQTLALAPRRIQVPKWSAERPPTGRQCGLHSDTRAIRADVFVELRKRRQHTFPQLSGGCVIDRFRCRSQ
jgi:hypothetical protein